MLEAWNSGTSCRPRFVCTTRFSGCGSRTGISSATTPGRPRGWKSCSSGSAKRQGSDPKETIQRAAGAVDEHVAVDQLSLKAATLDADAITRPICEDSGGIDRANNCYHAIICKSAAVVEPE